MLLDFFDGMFSYRNHVYFFIYARSKKLHALHIFYPCFTTVTMLGSPFMYREGSDVELMRAEACRYVYSAQGVPHLNLIRDNFACLLRMSSKHKKVLFVLGLTPNTSHQAFGTYTSVDTLHLQATQAWLDLLVLECDKEDVSVVAFNKQQYFVPGKDREVILDSMSAENNLIAVATSTLLVLKRVFDIRGDLRRHVPAIFKYVM